MKMTRDQKVLKFFGILDCVMGGLAVILFLLGIEGAMLAPAIIAVITGVLLLRAAADAEKSGAAFVVALLEMLLHAGGLVYLIISRAELPILIGNAFVTVMAMIVFAAARNIREEQKDRNCMLHAGFNG